MIELECPPPGSSPQVRAWFESIRRKVRALRPVESVGVLTLQTTIGVQRQAIRRAAASSSSDADLSLFVVKVYDQANGLLQCQQVSYSLKAGQDPDLSTSWTESIDSGLTTVLLPPAIAAGPVSTAHITEALQPSYGIGSRIIAARFGGVWYDINRDGRHWDTNYRLVNVCIKVNGVDTAWNMYIRAGEAFAPGT